MNDELEMMNYKLGITNDKNRLPSFTLLELITVLTISTIVIGMAYMAYELVYKDFESYKENTTATLATMDFVTVLERDVINADSIYIYQQEWILHQKNQEIIYFFDEDNVTKTINDDLIFSFDIFTSKDNDWNYLFEQFQNKKVIFE